MNTSYRFAGNKCSIRQVSNLFGLTKSLAHKVIDSVMNYLNEIAAQVIFFPETRAEKEAAASNFYNVMTYKTNMESI